MRSLAYKGYASTYNVDILNSFNPELQLQNTESAIKNKLKDLLYEVRGFKFVALVSEFRKVESDDGRKYITCYSNSKAETIMNQSDIHIVFELIYGTIISNIQKVFGNGFALIIDSFVNYAINISK